MTFAERLSQLMQKDGITKYRLSKLAGCSATTVANWLSGKEVTPLYLQKLSEIFSVTTDYLLGNDQKEKTPILTEKDERRISDEEIMAAFWGGDKDLSKEDLDEMWNDVRKFADFVKAEKKKKKGL